MISLKSHLSSYFSSNHPEIYLIKSITKLTQSFYFSTSIIPKLYPLKINQKTSLNILALKPKINSQFTITQCNPIFTLWQQYHKKFTSTNPSFTQFILSPDSTSSCSEVSCLIKPVDSQFYQSMKGWAYAGNHNGHVQFTQTVQIDMEVDLSLRTNFFTLKLLQIQYSLLKDEGMLNPVEKEQIVGKHNLYIKKYISKFTYENIHFFEEHSHISSNFILHYHVFIERTPEGLKRIIEEHQRLNIENRPRNGSFPESIKSSTFSDNINEIEVKGENRFAEGAHQVMQGQFVGSQTKLDPYFNSLNLKRKIKRSGPQINSQNSHKQQLFNSQFYNEPFTQRKAREPTHQENKLKETQKQQKQVQMLSPPLQSLHLKKLTSQQVKVNFDLFSPHKLKNKKINQDNTLSHQQKKRKLLEEFERKRIEFKKRIDSEKQLGNPLPEPLTDREFKRSNSMRSMRSVKSVRLTELERLPEQKPWVKKEKEKTRKLQTKVLYLLIVFLMTLVYIVMQPNRNSQSEDGFSRKLDGYFAQDKERPHKRMNHKRGKIFVKR